MNKTLVYRNISEKDLELTGKYDGSVGCRDKLLYLLGGDINNPNFPIEVLECEHRGLFGKSHNGKLFVMLERSDNEWINSGYASLEAICCFGRAASYVRDMVEEKV